MDADQTVTTGSRWWGGVPWTATTPESRWRRGDRDRAYRRLEVRTIWRQAACDTGLAHRIFSPTGITWAAPDLSDIDTGADEAFTVHLRTGQTWDQLRMAGRRIATAFGVRAIRLRELAPGWVRIELLPDYEPPQPPSPPDPLALGAAPVEPSVPSEPSRSTPRVGARRTRGHRPRAPRPVRRLT